MAAAPSPNYSDKQLLASDTTFENRVRQGWAQQLDLGHLMGSR
jgi:hypothetical protein